MLLRAPALIPSDQFAAQTHSRQDLYLFGFLSTPTAAFQEHMRKAFDAKQPTYLIHAFPKEWTQPGPWVPLGKLTIKNETEKVIEFDVGGQNQDKDFITEQTTLPPRIRIELENTFSSLAYVHTKGVPSARIGIHSPVRKETLLIRPSEWGNVGSTVWTSDDGLYFSRGVPA